MVRLAPNTPEYNRWDHSDKQRMQIMVTLIRRRVVDWNNHRQGYGEFPKLMEADLSDQELIDADFSNCDLRCANFSGSNLSNANFRGADLRGAKFTRAYGWSADFSGANLLEAVFDEARLDNAKLDDTNLLDARFRNASLKQASFKKAFTFRTNFERANLEGAIGITPDNTLIRDSHIGMASDDPWSTLRRKYTGPRVFMNLSVILIAILPFIAKAGFWAAVNRAQTLSLPLSSNFNADLAANLSKCLSAECQEVPLWRVTLGVDQGGYLWLAPLVLVFYNAMRLFITYRVAFLRDAEERTGYAPRASISHGAPFSAVDPLPKGMWARLAAVSTRTLHSYGWLYSVDRVLRMFLVVSLAAFVWHVVTWSRLTVWLPM